jgi:hypothetical protein
MTVPGAKMKGNGPAIALQAQRTQVQPDILKSVHLPAPRILTFALRSVGGLTHEKNRRRDP